MRRFCTELANLSIKDILKGEEPAVSFRIKGRKANWKETGKKSKIFLRFKKEKD